MKALICDKCGYQTCHSENMTAISFPYATLGQPDEQHLCPTCAEKLRRWLKGEPEEDSHDYSTGFPF